jgi:hypothetical protein
LVVLRTEADAAEEKTATRATRDKNDFIVMMRMIDVLGIPLQIGVERE